MGIETLGMIALGSSIVGGGLQAAGTFAGRSAAIQRGQAEGVAYEAKGQAADFNAAVARQQAAMEQNAAAAEAEDYERKGNAKVASGLAAHGASGVTMAGSPLMVDEATVREIALGVARQLHGGDVRAGRLREQAELSDFEGRNARTAAGYAREGGYLAGNASLLSGLGGAASSFGTAFGTRYGLKT